MRTLVYKKRCNNSDDQDNGDFGLGLQNFLDFGIINTCSFVHQCGTPGSVLPDHYPIEREGSENVLHLADRFFE